MKKIVLTSCVISQLTANWMESCYWISEALNRSFARRKPGSRFLISPDSSPRLKACRGRPHRNDNGGIWVEYMGSNSSSTQGSER